MQWPTQEWRFDGVFAECRKQDGVASSGSISKEGGEIFLFLL